jgi:ankyrin repeat protein
VNAKDRKGNTAVLYVVQNNCLQLSKQLVSEYGKNIYMKNHEGQSAYSLANESLRAKLKKLLVK